MYIPTWIHLSKEGNRGLQDLVLFLKDVFLHALRILHSFAQLGPFMDGFGLSPPYYSLDSCYPIENILEMVMELGYNIYLT